MQSVVETSPASPRAAVTRDWRIVLVVAGLYLAQGLPVGLAFQAYPTLLRNMGASLDLVALTPLASLPWVAKLFWAAAVENRWSPRLGRRRSWILPLQAGSVLTLAAMALVPFDVPNMGLLLGLIALLSLFSATQDIAVDGLAAERLPSASLGRVNTFQVSGFMVGMLLGGPGTMLLFDHFSAPLVFTLLAAVVLLCSLPVLFWQEPVALAAADKASLRRFFKRRFSGRLTALVMLVTLGGSTFFGLAKLILLDDGWSVSDVGVLAGVGQLLTIIVGCGVAGLLLRHYSRWSTLLTGLAMVGSAGVLWLGLVLQPGLSGMGYVSVATVLGGLGIGVTSVASYTLAMRFAQLGEQPGTDCSVFQGLQTLGDILVSSVAIGVAASWGYASGLGVGLLALGAALGMLWHVRRSTRGLGLDDA
ncbi:MFS transporter [Pseudomonas sp. BIGb0164]|uniref:MFS transporter n=1 Tax=Pseudomonas sp. BIGb0164 TaxID=2940605 RepID=UPI00216A05F5|nr:MFS transporter [Pseudomonas sp. BIGb0164]MCS4250539.1 RhtX/FptX family siderophore transporter [Pseudomonas sp. BIGb0164]